MSIKVGITIIGKYGHLFYSVHLLDINMKSFLRSSRSRKMVYWHKVKNIYLQRYLKRNQHWLLFFILSPPTLFYSSSIQWIDHHCGFPPPHGCLIRQVLDAHCCSHGQGQETRLALPLFSCSVRNQNKMQFNYMPPENNWTKVTRQGQVRLKEDKNHCK